MSRACVTLRVGGRTAPISQPPAIEASHGQHEIPVWARTAFARLGGIACCGRAALHGSSSRARRWPVDAVLDRAGSAGARTLALHDLAQQGADEIRDCQLDGQKVLKVDADKSYGNLVHPTRVQLNDEATLAWRWKVEAFVEGADLRTKGGDDGAAKVCVFFDFPADRLSVGERTKLALAKTSTGESVPTQTLCYVWDAKENKGSEFDNAFTKRIRMDVSNLARRTRPVAG